MNPGDYNGLHCPDGPCDKQPDEKQAQRAGEYLQPKRKLWNFQKPRQPCLPFGVSFLGQCLFHLHGLVLVHRRDARFAFLAVKSAVGNQLVHGWMCGAWCQTLFVPDLSLGKLSCLKKLEQEAGRRCLYR